ncbi:MAG: GTP cyclohydrolase FolE2 [Paracoccaceae bacterium]
MNIHTRTVEQKPSRDQLNDAMRVLRQWVAHSDSEKIETLDAEILSRFVPSKYPDLSAKYPSDFKVDETYKASMPDLQNGPSQLIKGENQQIQHVGISNFRLPIRYICRDGGEQALETSVTGTVSLDADKKGINMSRIMRSFYKHAEKKFSFDVMEMALDDYKKDLESFDARILMKFSFPVKVASLRSEISGYQYYDLALELVDHNGVRSKMLHLDYVYSSTCPCSLELSEHARRERGQLATPHSQRSVARISMVLNEGKVLWFEDLIDLCRTAVPTETQVMVKREDEQAFAELNAANPIFVEDAARLFCKQLKADARVGDFRVIASHQESLHSHDAISVLTEGNTFAQHSIDPKLFASLIHTG